jgi:hypothetical protein
MTASNTNDLTVFITSRTSRCDECKEDLGRHAWITLQGEGRAVCLACADLDHLVFLPSGDTALTRRARKHSRLSAVVLKWSQARKRYERQGLLVEEDALTQAEGACAADAATREATRARAAERRAELDEEYVTRFAARVRELYPGTPKGAKRDRRARMPQVQRSRGSQWAAKALDEDAVRLAVAAHVRHTETPYDDLLAGGCDRGDARARVNDQVAAVIRTWKCSSRKTQKPANTEPQTRHC